MKSFIIIVSFLVSTEIRFILCGTVKYDTTNVDKFSHEQTDKNIVELKNSSQNIPKETGLEIVESVPGNDKSQKLPGSLPLVGQESGTNKPSPIVTEDGADKKQGESIVDNIKNRAVANYKDKLKNAGLALEKVVQEVESLKEAANIEEYEVAEKSEEQNRRAASIVDAMRRRASIKLEQAKKNAKNEHDRAVSLANEKAKKATDEVDAALEAAYDKFEKIQEEIEENKRKAESEHQEILEKAQKERDDTLEAAKGRLRKAEENHKKSMKNKTMTSEESAIIEDELQKEKDIYEDALEEADNKWQTVLNDLGIDDKYDAALDEAVMELEEAPKKADSILNKVKDEKEMAIKTADNNKLEAERRAEAERSKVENECKEILIKAKSQQNNRLKKVQRQQEKIMQSAYYKIRKANHEFLKAKQEATNELNEALQRAEMEQKTTKVTKTENTTPKKLVRKKNQQSRMPRKKIPKSVA